MTIRPASKLGIWIFGSFVFLVQSLALADDGSSSQGGPHCGTARNWTRVATSDLDKMRGGFDSGGLSIVFSIERSVGLNGQIPVNWSTSTNWIAVQNQINGQHIEITTLINATLSELGLLRSLSLQAALQAAVIGSVRH